MAAGAARKLAIVAEVREFTEPVSMRGRFPARGYYLLRRGAAYCATGIDTMATRHRLVNECEQAAASFGLR